MERKCKMKKWRTIEVRPNNGLERYQIRYADAEMTPEHGVGHIYRNGTKIAEIEFAMEETKTVRILDRTAVVEVLEDLVARYGEEIN